LFKEILMNLIETFGFLSLLLLIICGFIVEYKKQNHGEVEKWQNFVLGSFFVTSVSTIIMFLINIWL